MFVYADNAATTRLSETALAAMLPCLREQYGNPSSLHAAGQAASGVLVRARETMARLLGCAPHELVFTSGDESIATVDANGRITAVSEGKTVIYITCGDKQLTCPVTCQFEAETEPSTEATVAAQTAATIQPEPAETKPQVELKLDRTDMRLQVGYSTQLKLVDCGDLKPEDVEWSVEHAYIAKVENGYVTALKSGTTEITAKYGDQTVKCIVRCHN